MAEKYLLISPYVYVANNPLIFVDPDGQRIDVSGLLKDNEGIYVLINLLMDLSDITGSGIGMKDGEIVNHGRLAGLDFSWDASNFVNGLINSNQTVTVKNDNSIGSEGRHLGSAIMNLNSKQIDDHIATLQNAGMEGRSFGYGMTFLHEALHSPLGKAVYNGDIHNYAAVFPGYDDPADIDTDGDGIAQVAQEPGEVVSIVNKFRTQLGWQTRTVYASTRYTDPATGSVTRETMKWSGKEIEKVKMDTKTSALRRINAIFFYSIGRY